MRGGGTGGSGCEEAQFCLVLVADGSILEGGILGLGGGEGEVVTQLLAQQFFKLWVWGRAC